jgi:hypothetical protein
MAISSSRELVAFNRWLGLPGVLAESRPADLPRKPNCTSKRNASNRLPSGSAGVEADSHAVRSPHPEPEFEFSVLNLILVVRPRALPIILRIRSSFAQRRYRKGRSD